jgi:sulfite exporter TauE/SafE
LLASVIAAREEEEVENHVNKRSPVFPTLAFLVAKLVAHSLLGFILGAFGEVISINQTVQVVMQLVAGLYMVAVALNLLNIHPIFRYTVIQPPRFLTRRVRNQSKSKELFAPAFLGAMTIFIPCGTTLAMEALAISSANPLAGAAIMATFVLGTTPLFFGIGWITSVLGDNFRTKFLKIAAVAIIYLGLSSINGAFIALGFPLNSQNITEAFSSGFQKKNEEKLYSEVPTSQSVEIVVSAGGYSPNYIKVKKGSPVTVKLIGKDAFSCASAFRIPSLNISKNLQANETYTFNFTPEKIGKIRFACSMGMYTGVIEVI